MDYELIDMGGYNLHIIKTKKFKTITMQVMFRDKVKKEDITIRNLLRNVLFNSNKDYKTERQLNIQIEKLYDLKLGTSSFSVGNYTNMCFSTKFLNEKYTESGMNETSIRFLLDIIFKPNINDNKFDEDIVSKEKDKIKKSLMSLMDNKQRYALIKLFESTKDKPYSYNFYGYEEDLDKLNSTNLYTYYEQMLKTNSADIFFVGDVDSKEIKDILKEYFKIGVFHKESKDIISEELKVTNKIIKLEEEVNVNQTQLTILCSLHKLSDFERRYVLRLYNELLGGSSNSILFNDVREKNSYAYYIYSDIQAYDNILYICSGIENGNEDKVFKVIKKSISKVNKGSFDEEYLNSCKESVISTIKASMDNPSGIINTYFAKYFVDSDTSEKRIENINKVTKEDIINLGKKIKLHTQFILKGVNDEED